MLPNGPITSGAAEFPARIFTISITHEMVFADGHHALMAILFNPSGI